MNTVKKVVALLLCLQLTSVQTVFAQANVQPQKVTQQEIAKKISSTDPYRVIGLVAVAGWATAACALTIMIKNGIKRAQRTHKQQLDIILEELLAGAKSKTIPPYKISEAGRFMKESYPVIQSIEEKGYFYKYYKALPTPDDELPQFWEKAYTKNGGKIPATLNEYRNVLSKFQTEFDRELYVHSTKKSQAMSSLIIDINEKFFSFEALESSSSEEAKNLLSSIEKDVKKLTSIAAKETPQVQNAVGVFTAQLNKEIEFKNFRDALTDMQIQAEKAYAGRGTQYAEEISKLAAEINANFRNMASADNAAAKNKFSAAIERDSKALAELAAKSEAKGIKEAANTFLSRISKEVKGKGGIIGLGVILVAGTALVLISGNAQAATISDSRLLAQRELAFSFQNTPDMFLVTVLNAREKYGIEAVSSVIYEKQKDYYPLFANQLQVMSDPKGKECLKLLVQGNNKSAEQNKAALVSDLKF